MSTDEQKWMGVPALDGARVGSLRLYQYGIHRPDSCDWSIKLRVQNDAITVVPWCPLSEVGLRTRAWIRSLAELLPEWGALQKVYSASEALRERQSDDTWLEFFNALAEVRELVKP